MQKGLTNFFEEYLARDTIFAEKKAIQSSYIPSIISHRDEQINQIASIIAPSLKSERVSNLFIYGKPGTGKTLSVKHTTSKLLELAKSKGVPLSTIYINCKLKKVADTEYRLIAHLARECGKDVPDTGLPTSEVYRMFFSSIGASEKTYLLILDEIDVLAKKAGDEILYNLTRINEELKNAQISLIGISNDLVFVDNLDPRVKSSLSEEEVVFPPYNAPQIQGILKERAQLAFKPGVLAEGVIEKCAAYAAREHGDARRALEVLRVAGELAERGNSPTVSISHIDQAEEKIEKDRISHIISTQPKQYQAILYSVLQTAEKKEHVFTGEVYEFYRALTAKTGLRPLTQRRVSDVIAEFDMFGIINAKVISKGRYGRTREIFLSPHLQTENVTLVLQKALDL
ncbi:MAG TPA: orc1/cdc6 family replication initiation protein [Candidatus Nanoarchaeia archaeon]|nr:orc1/cdc6 family replication initiation protein [Candidatus Nanoarchaeia archaeon]